MIDSVIFGQLILDFETCPKKVFKELKFLSFPSNVGIVVVSDFGSLEILLMLLWKFTELLLFANCWRANKNWSASIVASVFSLRKCGWLVERFFFCFPEDVQGGQYVTSSWTPVILWQSPIRSVAPVTMSWPQILSLSLSEILSPCRGRRLSLSLSLSLFLSLSELLSPCRGPLVGQSFVSSSRGMEEAPFSMRIILGVVLVRSLARI